MSKKLVVKIHKLREIPLRLGPRICHGCLSLDRELSSIKENDELYQIITDNRLFDKNIKVLLCWECGTVLKKMKLFKVQVRHAANILLLQKNNVLVTEPKSLSKLSKWMIDDFAFKHKIEDIKSNEEASIRDKIDDMSKTEILSDTVFKSSSYDYESTHMGSVVNVSSVTNTKVERECIDDNIEIKQDDNDNYGDDPATSEDIEIKQEDDDDHYEDDPATSEDIEVKQDDNDNYGDDPATSEDIEIKQEDDNDNYGDDPATSEDINIFKDEKQKQRKYIKFPRHKKYTRVKKYEKELIVKVNLNNESNVVNYMEMEKKCEYYIKAKFKCDKCLVVFNSQELLMKHQGKLHNHSLPYMCIHCESCFTNDADLQKHLKSHHIAYQCRACNFDCYTKSSIYKHLKSHQGCIKCNFCGHIDNNVTTFYDHYRKYHKNFICDFCNVKRTTKLMLEIHIRVHHMPTICNICGAHLKHYNKLKQHIRRVHTVKRDECSYCVICDKQFDNEFKFLKHFRLHSKEKKKKQKYVCSFCNKVLSSNRSLQLHIRMIHEKKTDYHCVQCDKYYVNAFRLRIHIKTCHEGKRLPKKYLCNTCGMGFTERSFLNRHVLTHTGERPFKCDFCPVSYNQRHRLKSHLEKQHEFTGEIPYYCKNGVIYHISQKGKESE